MKKRRITARVLAFSRGIAPTKERQRQDGGVVVEVINEQSDGITYTRRHRANFASALDVYRFTEDITEEQWKVGRRFGREYARSVGKVKMSEFGSGSHGDPEMRAISAINSNAYLKKAFDALTLMRREVLISVCVDNKRAGGVQRIRTLALALQIISKECKGL